MLNGIENNIESLHYNLDRANVHITSINSFSGQLANNFASPDGGYQGREFTHVMANALENKGPDVVNILRKRENTSLSPATLTIMDSAFFIHDNLENKDYSFRYTEIKYIVIRNRALHLDLRFHNGKRERIVSGYSQHITNELSLRAGNDCSVVFETYATHFEYGMPELRERLSKVSSLARANESVGGYNGFVRRSHSGVSAEVQTASDTYRNDLLVQEQHIDQISELLGDLGYMTNAIGMTVDQQNDQIRRITGRTDEGIQKLKATNQRIDDISSIPVMDETENTR